MNRLKILLVTTLNVVLVGCGGSQIQRATTAPAAAPAVSSPANGKGQQLFEKDCVACHQPSVEGGTVKVEDKRIKVPSLKSDKVIKGSDEDYADQILKGGDGMPAFKGKLKEDEISDLIRFIRREIQGKETAK